MARKVFFSFYHKGDSKRIGIVRNHGMCKDGIEEAGYTDAAEWEKLELEGRAAIARWINGQLEGTSLTTVLIGEHTHTREWVDYEIKQSFDKGNALLGVYIHNLKGLDEKVTAKGLSPFDNFVVDSTGESLAALVKTYDWVDSNGYDNFAAWVEEAVSSWKKPEGSITRKGGGTKAIPSPTLPPVPGPHAPPMPPRRREVG